MKKAFLKSLGINWDPRCCLPPIDSLQTVEEKEHFHTTVTQVTNAIRRFDPLKHMLGLELSKKQFHLIDPDIVLATIMLTKSPREEVYFSPKANLYAEVLFNPMELVSVPQCKNEIGDLAVQLYKNGLTKLSKWTDFPVDFCRIVLRKFESENYTYSWEIKNKLIDKKRTRLKVIGSISGEKTICTLIVERDEAIVYEQEVWAVQDTHWQLAHRLDGISISNGKLVVGNPSDRLVDAFVVSLDEIPPDARSALITRTGRLRS